jgi:hypothetical protein
MQAVKIAMTLRAGADREIMEANLAFHLRAGVDAIVVWAPEGRGGALEELPPDDRVHRAAPRTTTSASAAARWSVRELAPDWLIESDQRDFWWPRVATLTEALAGVPSGSNAAQAVVRTLFPVSDDATFEERFTMRLSPRGPSIDDLWRPERRFAVRADAAGTDPAELDVLWGYYPFEVLRLAEKGMVDPAGPTTERATELGVLVPDTRLRDALHTLRAGPGGDVAFRTTGEPLTFGAPDPAEEAVFALEAAVINDLELAQARQRLDVLSQRLRTIERSRLLRAEAALRRAARRLRKAAR